ncbi:hypothetical protein [Streptomyces mirabilis]
MYQDEYLPRHPDLAAESARLVAAGKLTLPSAPLYKAKDFTEALAYMEKNGKVLLDFNPHRGSRRHEPPLAAHHRGRAP